MRALEWHLPDRVLTIGRRPLIMGIVNVTPDSFSDGGQHNTSDAAIAHGLHLIEEGADLLDIGGESTRPGATPVALDEEVRRVVPVIGGLAKQTRVPLSVDTYKAVVARACLAAGATIVNDIMALGGDHAMPQVVAEARAGVILMHMQGTPPTMQLAPAYQDVVAEVGTFLEQRLQVAVEMGIAADRIVVDPGIGFGKTGRHNLQLLAHLDRLRLLGRPICLGVSRKGFIGKLLGREVWDRLVGSLAALGQALSRGAVQIVRVHDVKQTRDFVEMWNEIEDATEPQRPAADRL
jgi:dihydropteroate synthase